MIILSVSLFLAGELLWSRGRRWYAAAVYLLSIACGFAGEMG
jgi:hypothetical protein